MNLERMESVHGIQGVALKLHTKFIRSRALDSVWVMASGHIIR